MDVERKPRRGLQVALLVVAAAAATYARVAINPLQEALRAALSLSDNQVALLQGPAIALPVLAAAIPVGLLIDRFSRVRLLLGFAWLDIGAGVFTACAPNFAALFVARGLVGIAVMATSTTVFSLLADVCKPTQRGRAGMVVVVGQYAGLSVAFACGARLLASFATGSEGWRWAALWMNVPLLAMIPLLLFMREPERTEVAAPTRSTRASLGALWQYRAVITPVLIGLIMADIAIFAVLTWAAPMLTRTFAVRPERADATISIVVLASGVVGPVIGGTLADLGQRMGGPKRTITALAVLALLGIPAGSFAFLPDATAAAIVLTLFMSFGGATLVAGVAVLSIVIPNELRGLCIATSFGAQYLLGVGLAPVVISVLSGALGGPATLGSALSLVCIAVSCAGALALGCGRRHFSAQAL